MQAAYSKHRREDVLPVHPSLAELLQSWLATKPVNKPVWPGNWARTKCGGKILQRDLKAAGIPYLDENGLYADFHALRHTFITNMVKSGVSPKTAQSLARHCTIDLTMNVYTSLTMIDQAEALAVLPSVPRPEAPASGGTQEPECHAAGRKKMAAMVSRGAGNRVQRLASEEYRPVPDDTERQENEDAGTPDSLRHASAAAASCGTQPCYCGTTIDPDLQQVIVSWNRLPQSTRDAISILVRG